MILVSGFLMRIAEIIIFVLASSLPPPERDIFLFSGNFPTRFQQILCLLFRNDYLCNIYLFDCITIFHFTIFM